MTTAKKKRVAPPTLEGARAAADKALGGPTDETDWAAYEAAMGWVLQLEAEQAPRPLPSGTPDAYLAYIEKKHKGWISLNPSLIFFWVTTLISLLGIIIGTIFISMAPPIIMFFVMLMIVGYLLLDV